MILAMGRDIRVVLIKLADRLHNMRTLKFQPVERQVAIARETLDIYAPLAHRLGVYTIKAELEDLSLRYIDPEGYQDVARKVGMKRAEREENIKIVIEELSQKLKDLGMHFEVAGRPKHLYSIYRKMVIQNKPFDQIYDLIAHPRAGGYRAGLLHGAGRVPYAVDAGARTLQGLYFGTQKQHVPVAAHHGDRRPAHSLPL